MCDRSYLSAASFAVVIAVCSVEDLRHRRIPDRLLGAGFIVSFLLSPSLGESVTGGAVGISLFFAVRLLCRGRLGFGDVKLAGYLAAVLGTRLWWITVALASTSALAVMLFRTCSGRAGPEASLPFAPFLSLASLASLVLQRTTPSLIAVLST